MKHISVEIYAKLFVEMGESEWKNVFNLHRRIGEQRKNGRE